MSESVYHLQHMGLSLSGEAPPTFCLPRSANQKNVCKNQESEGRIKTNHFLVQLMQTLLEMKGENIEMNIGLI